MKLFGFELIRPNELKQLKEKSEKLDSLFDFDHADPELTYEQFCENKNFKDVKSSLQYHPEYWDEQYVHLHMACIIGKLALVDPRLLRVFLEKFSSLDWKRINDYMIKDSWTWGSHNRVPSINELKYCVISLIPLDNHQDPENTISSGGFSVTLNYVDNKPNCNITFDDLIFS